MPRRKVLTGFLLAVGSLAGTVFYRRRVARRRERVDVYFADGSMISYTDSSSEGGSLLVVARDALAAVRP